jgi:hypothetical protein
MAIPGTRFLAFAARWFDAATVSRVFEPLVADWQREWIDASESKRAWIRVRGTIAFAATTLAMSPRVMLMTPSPPAMTRRVLSRIIIFTSIGTLVMTAPMVYAMREAPWQTVLVLAIFLLPSVMVTVLPFAMPWVADGLRPTRAATPAERVTALRTAFACVAFALVFIGWAMPMANQAYREVAAPEWAPPPLRGVRELTLTELTLNPPRRMQGGRNVTEIRREINSRVVIAVLPAILLWLRWGAHATPRRRWLSPLPVAIETALAFVAFFSLYMASVANEPAFGLRAGTGLWFAPLALLVAGVLRNVLSRRFNAGSHA